MALLALHTAATGLNALSTELDVTANNLANVNTTGFKAQRVNFEDLLYQHKRQPGVENAQGDLTPAGCRSASASRSATPSTTSSRAPPCPPADPSIYTSKATDLSKSTSSPKRAAASATPAPATSLPTVTATLVLGNSQGPRVVPGVTLPLERRDVGIAPDGTVSVTLEDGTIANVGQISLATFVNKEGLKSIGGNLFVETPASGPPIEGNPGDGSLGTLLNGHLESSNVDPVLELVSLIKTQRAFEINSQTIQAADEVMQVVGNLRR